MSKLDLPARPVSVGTFKASASARRYINDVLDTGKISYGKYSQRFEQEFAKLHDCRYAILSNSGTSALQVALQAMKEVNGWGDWGRVIVPATTFVATANIVRHNRMTPAFVDVEPDTFNIDPSLIEKEITDETRAIIPVHLFGQPADMTAINDIAFPHRIKVIEDSCETMFASHDDAPVGSWGHIGCFSTYVAHMIVTGVGGISITDDEDYAGKMRSLVNHGLEIEFLNPDRNFSPQPMPGRRFRFDSVGHSYRITELEAALGCAGLEDFSQMVQIRKANAYHYESCLKDFNRSYGNPFHLYGVKPKNTCSFMMYPILLNKNEDGSLVDKEPLMRFLNESMIETRDCLPILGQKVYSWLDPDRYPVSKWIAESGFYVGCHQDLTAEDIQYVVERIGVYLDEHHGTKESSS